MISVGLIAGGLLLVWLPCLVVPLFLLPAPGAPFPLDTDSE